MSGLAAVLAALNGATDDTHVTHETHAGAVPVTPAPADPVEAVDARRPAWSVKAQRDADGSTALVWPSGYAMVAGLTFPAGPGVDPADKPADMVKRITALQDPALWAKVGRTKDGAGRLPRLTVPSWADAGKQRELDACLHELDKVLAKSAKRAGGVRADVIGREVLPGWKILSTDGKAAICERVTPGGKPLQRTELTYADEMPINGWREYAKVRPASAETEHAWVHWAWTRTGALNEYLTFYAENGHRGDGGDISARAWRSACLNPALDSATFALSDRYVWPLRGLTWDVSVGKADGGRRDEYNLVVFAAGNRGVVIMGKREAR